MTPIEEFEKELASEKLGIYYPHPDDLGSEILIPLQAEIKNFLQRNLQFFELDNIEFHCIKFKKYCPLSPPPLPFLFPHN